MDDTTRANGYKHGRPEGRDVKPADEIVRKVIEALPAETRLYPDVYAWQVTDALEAATSAPAVDREALAALIVAILDEQDGASPVSMFEFGCEVFDRAVASGILRDVRDVQAEALEQAAVEIREQMVADEIAIHGLAYSAQLPERSLTMLNGAQRFMERLRARAQAIREASSER